MRDEALRVIASRPVDFARATVARLGRFWGVAPSAAVYAGRLRWLTAAWTAPLWVALLLGLTTRGVWVWPRVAAPLTILALTAVHSVFWTDMRMRATVVPAVALVVAASSPRAREGSVP